MNKMLSNQKTAGFLGISTSELATIRELFSFPQPVIQAGSRVFFVKSDVSAWAERAGYVYPEEVKRSAEKYRMDDANTMKTKARILHQLYRAQAPLSASVLLNRVRGAGVGLLQQALTDLVADGVLIVTKKCRGNRCPDTAQMIHYYALTSLGILIEKKRFAEKEKQKQVFNSKLNPSIWSMRIFHRLRCANKPLSHAVLYNRCGGNIPPDKFQQLLDQLCEAGQVSVVKEITRRTGRKITYYKPMP